MHIVHYAKYIKTCTVKSKSLFFFCLNSLSSPLTKISC